MESHSAIRGSLHCIVHVCCNMVDSYYWWVNNSVFKVFSSIYDWNDKVRLLRDIHRLDRLLRIDRSAYILLVACERFGTLHLLPSSLLSHQIT